MSLAPPDKRSEGIEMQPAEIIKSFPNTNPDEILKNLALCCKVCYLTLVLDLEIDLELNLDSDLPC